MHNCLGRFSPVQCDSTRCYSFVVLFLCSSRHTCLHSITVVLISLEHIDTPVDNDETNTIQTVVYLSLPGLWPSIFLVGWFIPRIDLTCVCSCSCILVNIYFNSLILLDFPTLISKGAVIVYYCTTLWQKKDVIGYAHYTRTALSIPHLEGSISLYKEKSVHLWLNGDPGHYRTANKQFIQTVSLIIVGEKKYNNRRIWYLILSNTILKH